MSAPDLPKDLRSAIRDLCAPQDFPYTEDACYFVLEVVARAVADPGRTRLSHIRGQELCTIAARLAVEDYGPFASMILAKWGIRETMDLGRLVFALADGKVLGLSEQDSLRDFDGVLDFQQALANPFRADPPFPDLPAIRLVPSDI
ncbi:MAG: hypothetical protein IJJ33_09765 [Victivallales bacterium]|nr:hypothetical protein [Victivallales bacterium]